MAKVSNLIPQKKTEKTGKRVPIAPLHDRSKLEPLKSVEKPKRVPIAPLHDKSKLEPLKKEAKKSSSSPRNGSVKSASPTTTRSITPNAKKKW